MMFDVKITIALKHGMLDPEARAIQHALSNLGFATDELSSARVYHIRFDAAGKDEANGRAQEMCERLLANPIIHDFTIEVVE